MGDADEKFELKKGATIVVPAGKLSYQKVKASNKKRYPETPYIMELNKYADGTFSFRSLSQKDGRRFYLFVPGKLFAGDRLIVQWTENNCACAHAAINVGVH